MEEMNLTRRSRTGALEAAGVALEKKAEDVQVLEVLSLSSVTDYLVICTVFSEAQARAVSDAMVRGLRKAGFRCHHIEGKAAGQWVLMDFVDFVCHVMREDVRSHYDLEGLWADAPIRECGEEDEPAKDVDGAWGAATVDRAPSNVE